MQVSKYVIKQFIKDIENDINNHNLDINKINYLKGKISAYKVVLNM